MSSPSPDPVPAVQPRRRGRRSLHRLGLILATAAALTAAAVALPHDPRARYQGMADTIYARAAWIYDRIHHDDAPIDILILGSSRTGAGVYPTLLEPALAARGIDARVVNFALPATGLDIRQTLAAEVFSAKAPRLVIYDVGEALPRDGHEAFGDLGTVREILGAPWIVNRRLPGHLLRLPMRQIGLSLATLLPAAWGRQPAFDPATYAGTTVDPRSFFAFEDDLGRLETAEHAEMLAAQAARRKREITPPILPGSLSWIEFGVSQSYLRETVALAEANGARVAFLFLPFYTGPEAPREQALLETWGPVWSAAFLRNDPRNYVDSGHSAASPRVKAMLTEWLADRIAEELGAE